MLHSTKHAYGDNMIINAFKYMAFLCMQESRRGDCRWEEKAAKKVQMAGNYQVAKDFNPDDHPYPTWSEIQLSLQRSHPSQEHS